jgi:hypothetical protein
MLRTHADHGIAEQREMQPAANAKGSLRNENCRN